ncbi:MAG: sensor histidine kinase [Solirubrobacteraceae bacterium]
MGAVTLGGWTAAILAALAALGLWRALGGRMEAVARACHELRGPITAARLGLQLGMRSGDLSDAHLRAVELELGQASLALDDLAQAREPRRVREPREARQRRRGWPRREARRSTQCSEDVDIPELLADSVQAWRATALSKGVDLRLGWSGAPAAVLGDRVRLAQAVGNLIANAIEHGGGVVQACGHERGANVYVEVTDRGPGLPAPVAQLTRRAHGGRGARGRGLAIASAIAEDHGGRLSVAPSEGGARLVLELPRLPGA